MPAAKRPRSGASAVARPRRTQAERRAATRGAVLDAALDELVEHGYGAMTTRRVGERASVSQGTVMHYFRSRPELVGEVVRHASSRFTEEITTVGRTRARTPRTRFVAMLDALWEVQNGPIAQAVTELWVVGRREPAVADAVREAQHDVVRQVSAAVVELFPGIATTPQGVRLLDEVLAISRGMSFDSLIGDRADADRRWDGVRAGLVARFEALVAELGA
ncbi:TetR/AcrR family transcriptional regulator [Conexibacter sp. SYSU D00693]|uniref:TetR/AcrR family transcriptional regulator n=1 Tax=Conexibacter sp. SYSU D00693 TaxID=2812560 RepID=UPI00196A55DD|nr:TetR/AcrR family transcriptional regulator [Conexibacter sp. SYSU D00693]